MVSFTYFQLYFSPSVRQTFNATFDFSGANEPRSAKLPEQGAHRPPDAFLLRVLPPSPGTPDRGRRRIRFLDRRTLRNPEFFDLRQEKKERKTAAAAIGSLNVRR